MDAIITSHGKFPRHKEFDSTYEAKNYRNMDGMRNLAKKNDYCDIFDASDQNNLKKIFKGRRMSIFHTLIEFENLQFFSFFFFHFFIFY